MSFSATGKATVPSGGAARFDGRISANSSDLEPLLLLFGRPPALEGAGGMALSGTLKTDGAHATVGLESATVGGRAFGGQLELSPEATGWKIGGNIDVDTVDLAWLGSLSLGVEPMPTGTDVQPLGRRLRSRVRRSVRSTARSAFPRPRSRSAACSTSTTPSSRSTLHPDLFGVDLKSGTVAGGAIVGEIQVRNPTGDAAVTGHFAIRGGELGGLVWIAEGKPVASGHFDVRANFEATGRSVAGLVGSLGGDGAFAVHDGELRYANLGAFDKVLQASEAGKVFNGDQLLDLFRGTFDQATLPFQKVDGTFRMTAGKMRATNVKLSAGDAGSSGEATIDLNSLSVDSGWTISMVRKDERVSGAVPQVQVVFAGPLSAPQRQIDVSQFAEYLTLRALQREQVLHDKLVAERRERELAAARRAAGAAISLRSAREDAARWSEAGAAAKRAWQEDEAARKLAEEEELARKAREAEAARAAQERLKAEAESRPFGARRSRLSTCTLRISRARGSGTIPGRRGGVRPKDSSLRSECGQFPPRSAGRLSRRALAISPSACQKGSSSEMLVRWPAIVSERFDTDLLLVALLATATVQFALLARSRRSASRRL